MAHPDLDELLSAVVPFAQQMLDQHDGFLPFAASMSASGEVGLVGADTGDETPPVEDVFDLLIAAFHAQASEGEIRAAAICFDVRVVPPGESEKSDAIGVRLEHAIGEAVHVFLPYYKDDHGEYVYGDLFATDADHDIFGPPDELD